jgi:dihydroorotase
MAERAFDVVLRNAKLAGRPSQSGAEGAVDVGIRAGLVDAVGPKLEKASVEHDCGGALLLPGLVDNHVHYREPGAAWKEGWVTGSAASLRGGATRVGEIQNNAPLVETVEQWEAKVASISKRSRVRPMVYGCATRRNLATVKALAAAAPGVKLFMAADEALEVSDEPTLRQVFGEVAAAHGLLLLHAEDGPLVRAGLQRFGDRAQDFWLARSIDAERVAIERAIELSGRFGTRVHFFHVSSAAACAAIRSAKRRGLPVSAAACAHYLLFTNEDVAARGAILKCNPSIKTAEDRTALRAAVKDGTLDVIQSDHAPHPRAEKAKSFREAPSGIPGADLFLPLWLELVADGVLTLDDFVERGAVAPARLHGVHQRGKATASAVADFVLVENGSFEVRESDFASKAKLSPYVGRTLRHRVVKAWIGGKLAFDRAKPEDLAAMERAAPPPLPDVPAAPSATSTTSKGADPKGCC